MINKILPRRKISPLALFARGENLSKKGRGRKNMKLPRYIIARIAIKNLRPGPLNIKHFHCGLYSSPLASITV
ncbi:MAG: hypothetical protein KKG21_02250 [Candidatus Omnitrophica bacterium]|nr:hypothetical protein [Candidatus Omnitrophota bacterium]